MATVDCPGCGLPRPMGQEDQPCPVCEAGVHDLPAAPRADDAPLPFAHLPADNAQLHHTAGEAPPGHRPGVIAAVFGFAAGAVAVLAVQGLLPSNASPPAAVPGPPPTSPVAVVAAVQVEPIPPADTDANGAEPVAATPGPTAVVAGSGLEVAPPPRVPRPPTLVIEVDQPEETVNFPSSLLKPGQTAVVRGRAKIFSVSGLENGRTLDASGLVAEKVTVTGLIDGGSVLTVYAPKGVVSIGGPVTGGASVTALVPGGEFLFSRPHYGDRTVPSLKGDARVTVTAKLVDFRGEVEGKGTRVLATLADGGTLKLYGVRDTAVVEYRKSKPGDGAPNIDVRQRDPGATVRRAE